MTPTGDWTNINRTNFILQGVKDPLVAVFGGLQRPSITLQQAAAGAIIAVNPPEN
jgi:hypothetical protein